MGTTHAELHSSGYEALKYVDDNNIADCYRLEFAHSGRVLVSFQ